MRCKPKQTISWINIEINIRKRLQVFYGINLGNQLEKQAQSTNFNSSGLNIYPVQIIHDYRFIYKKVAIRVLGTLLKNSAERSEVLNEADGFSRPRWLVIGHYDLCHLL